MKRSNGLSVHVYASLLANLFFFFFFFSSSVSIRRWTYTLVPECHGSEIIFDWSRTFEGNTKKRQRFGLDQDLYEIHRTLFRCPYTCRLHSGPTFLFLRFFSSSASIRRWSYQGPEVIFDWPRKFEEYCTKRGIIAIWLGPIPRPV